MNEYEPIEAEDKSKNKIDKIAEFLLDRNFLIIVSFLGSIFGLIVAFFDRELFGLALVFICLLLRRSVSSSDDDE